VLLLCVTPLSCSLESEIAHLNCSFMLLHHIVSVTNIPLHCFITLQLLQLICHIANVVLLCHVVGIIIINPLHF
jgi:hypothetical protein